MARNLLFLFIFFLIYGCLPAKKIIPADSFSSQSVPVVTGSLVNSAAFERGGTIALGLFKPGPEAAANEETDSLSLMLIKGIKETLLKEKTHFTIAEDEQKNPDFLLEGYIENYAKAKRFSHTEAHLSVDGEIGLRETGEKILLFQSSAVINLKNQDPLGVAYQMGVAIAHFIGSQTN